MAIVLAYARGADGVSLFNFAYYREYGGPGRGPFAEPPFAVLSRLGDRALLARQPQHRFLAPGWAFPFAKESVLPRSLSNGQTAAFTFDLAPPEGGWKMEARLRVQTLQPLNGARLTVKFNDTALAPTDNISEPFESLSTDARRARNPCGLVHTADALARRREPPRIHTGCR